MESGLDRYSNEMTQNWRQIRRSNTLHSRISIHDLKLWQKDRQEVIPDVGIALKSPLSNYFSHLKTEKLYLEYAQ